MEKKLMLFVAGILIVLALTTSFLYKYSPPEQNEEDLELDLEFFKENNIIDDAPIGRDLNGYWIYQTADNQIIKTKDYPTTERGIEYAELVLNKGG